MRAGKMDREITIAESLDGVPDEYGNIQEGWNDIATVRAQIVQGTTEEFMRAYGETAETAIVFRIRWLDGLTTEHSVTYEGVRYNIRELKEIGRRKGLDIRCVGRAE